MKQCPRCKKPIYNNRRYYGFLLKAYKDVEAVKKKYFREKKTVRKQDLLLLLQDSSLNPDLTTKLRRLESIVEQTYRHLSDAELNLVQFQGGIIHRANSVLTQAPQYTRKLAEKVHFVVSRVMEQKLRITTQMMEEITGELQRLAILPAYWNLSEKLIQNDEHILMSIHRRITKIFSPTVKFNDEKEREVRELLKESEKYLGQLGITDAERMEIINAMGLKQGHWYKCPKGHYYCIANCGRAVVESKCPECGAPIGGRNHRLRSDNTVAAELFTARNSYR
nr:NFX1-type zinc finger-containing protein 1-like [Cherax quadricarinatus]